VLGDSSLGECHDCGIVFKLSSNNNNNKH
jgi:hypothetical protein